MHINEFSLSGMEKKTEIKMAKITFYVCFYKNAEIKICGFFETAELFYPAFPAQKYDNGWIF